MGVLCCLLAFGCAGESIEPARLNGAMSSFDIHWPPRDPENANARTAQPLLLGSIALEEVSFAAAESELRLALTITRPSTESNREFWNSRLAYADLSWMDEVRVWDSASQWLWPNLPFLLRRHGEERVQRYGGVDPGKHVDNDFAAVLIRKYDASGSLESNQTREFPLVSAGWHPDPGTTTDLQSVVHVARSDWFTIHLGSHEKAAAGKLKVWLIYADFLGSRPPKTWPKNPEWAGGILAYCEVDWEKVPGEPCRGLVRHKKPSESTGFDWAAWSGSEPVARACLSDAAQ